ncbi:MAG: 50S ribosomal protein L3 [Chloroflexi bacterium]|nr:50S ribosomal protein L3 [Chloroflexota bacterium]
MKGIIGRKLGMTRVFDETGVMIPVTVIQAGPCYVTQVKRTETDGYEAIQIGFEETKPNKLNKPRLGHLKKHDLPPLRILREIRVEDAGQYEVGQVLTVEMFQPGDLVDVTGTSKGRGFQGGVKRYGFGGGPRTHGQSDRLRAPGSIGAGTYPGRVLPGTRMAGRMGNERVTVRNLEIIGVDPENHLIWVKGAVPGHKKGLVIIREAVHPGKKGRKKTA